ncbi:VIT domain-containing protein [Dokdonia ponticola]|uniref:VIT domain-containing protein n=1 Tax=Dokdonia ponticola TaxID=2041041 RepID=A0ABV9I339_9FLAO
MKKAILVGLLCLYSISYSYAQKIPFVRVNDKPLGLSSLDIDVVVTGNIATTTYDMLFYNPTDAILEGQLDFPLGDGFSVSRFALDINGKLREAVVVDKELGRVAFEAVVRRRVDPALLEKGTGNNYKARIYPIPAKGYKRIVLAYEQELKVVDGNHYYDLPLAFENTLENFDLAITVFDQKTKPIIEKGAIRGLGFTPWQQNFKTTLHKENFTPNSPLRIQIPIEKTAIKQLRDEEYVYVYTTLRKEKRLRQPPKTITLLWDASLSMKSRDITKELALLDTYFSKLSTVDVALVTFSNTVRSSTTYTIKNNQWDGLKEALENTVYDGGTDYSILDTTTLKGDAILLFTDGMHTLSQLELYSQSPVFTINSLVKANHQALRTLADTTNGGYINLIDTDTKEALTVLTDLPFRFLGYTCSNASAQVYPNTPVTVTNDFSVAGKGFKNGDRITLQFGYGNKVLKEVVIQVDDAFAKSDIIKRLWAKEKLQVLAQNVKRNKEAITQLGTEYQLVTDYTSLIVLDDVMDYVRYQITPPAELVEEYNRIVSEQKSVGGEELAKRTEVASNARRQASQRRADSPSEDVLENLQENTEVYNMSAPPPPMASDIIEVVEDMEIVEGLPVASPSESIITEDEVQEQQSQSKYKGKLELKDRTINTQYLNELREIKNADKAYEYYLIQRTSYQEQPAYFIDVATYFKDTFNHQVYARRIVSNIPELDGDNYELLKVFGYQMQLEESHDIAAYIFERILELRPEDSQSYRDLALAYENIGKCQEALDLLLSIVDGTIYKNNKRRVFEGVKTISENEIKHLIREYKDDLKLDSVSNHLKDLTPMDVRVVIDWNHNDTDIDLHIIDPNLEECYYSHNKTTIGGRMSQDMTQGFGPEEYSVQKAIKGDYYVKVRYYGDSYQKVENPTFMKVTMYTHYGTNKETKETQILRLTRADNEQLLAKLTF